MRQKHKRVMRLRQLRRARELTQVEIAKRVGIHRNAYNAIEKGRSEPGLETAKKIAAVFQQPVEHVFAYVEVPAS
jgi:putative transcriptional regulator